MIVICNYEVWCYGVYLVMLLVLVMCKCLDLLILLFVMDKYCVVLW